MALSPLNSSKKKGNKGLLSSGTRSGYGKSTATKSIRVGDICNLKITALAANNIGIDEYSFAYAVFVPNAKIGSQIKAKIVKVKESSYAVAKLLEEKTVSTVADISVKPGDILTVSIKKQMENGSTKAQAGIVELTNNFRLIIPFTDKKVTDLDNIKVKVTRVKSNYGFARIEKTSVDKKMSVKEVTENTSTFQNKEEVNLEVGSKFTITLPSSCVASLFGRNIGVNSSTSNEGISEAKSKGLKSFTKGNGKFVVLNVKNSILFLQLKKGANSFNSNSALLENLVMNGKLRVRIKITSKSANCLVGKIVQVNPISKTRKTAFILKNISEMITHGMHFGEKAVKCNARMKNYIWLTSSR
ncbi:MAG: hypothetical protein MUF43_11775 [Flavobacterium sp.]|jgi:predicted RNA-binding protein with TRAM domain|nr:hypothetical protein [Flavobacterium sp.]